jgi:hypothetical protein
MRQLLDLVFTARAIRRALGVAIIGGLMGAFGFVKRSHLLEQSASLSSDERVWTAWVETGATVAGLALLFVALGLIWGRSPEGSSTLDPESAERSRT